MVPWGGGGGTKKQMGILAQTCKKRGVKSTGKKVGNGKKPSGRLFLSNSRKICHHFAFLVYRKTIS